MRSAGTALLVLLFAAVGVLSWSLQLRETLAVDAGPLLALPAAAAGWRSVDVPLEGSVESMLRADANLQRIYTDATGEKVSLYVGYYGTERGGRPEHTPEVCYRSQGWDVLERRVLDVPEASGLRVKDYLVESRAGRRDLVVFWFRSHRRSGLLGGLDQSLDRLLGRLLDGRADGSLVRISTPVRPGEETAARGTLLDFARAVDVQLGAHWPAERASSGPRP
jgi:EpsI family protein